MKLRVILGKNTIICFVVLLSYLSSVLPGRAEQEQRLVPISVPTQMEKESEKQDQNWKQYDGELKHYQQQLAHYHSEGGVLLERNASEEECHQLFERLCRVRKKMDELLEKNRPVGEEGYLFWHSGGSSSTKMTLSELIYTFASHEAVYLIPEGCGEVEIQLVAQAPIPKALWPQMVEAILEEHGFSIRSLNPYMKQLVCVSEIRGTSRGVLGGGLGVSYLASQLQSFRVIDPQAQVGWLVPLHEIEWVNSGMRRGVRDFNSHAVEEMYPGGERNAWMDQFRLRMHPLEGDGTSSFALLIGRASDILSFGSLKELVCREKEKELASRCESWMVLPVQHLPLIEAQNVLNHHRIRICIRSLCGELDGVSSPGERRECWLLQGEGNSVEEAHALLLHLEQELCKQKSATREQYVYTCQHRTSQELYDILNDWIKEQKIHGVAAIMRGDQGKLLIQTDATTYDELIHLIRAIDLPQTMVRLDVLFFERKLKQSQQAGWKEWHGGALPTPQEGSLGHAPHAPHAPWGISFHQHVLSLMFEVPELLLKGIYHTMLLNQEMQLSAAPSVITANGVQAEICMADEISILTGTWSEEGSKKVHKQFVRENVGLNLKMTPYVCSSSGKGANRVRLDLDLQFNHVNRNENDRPDISRRSINNQVTLDDGETMIFGGIRRKEHEQRVHKIPLLGQLPVLGVLFQYREEVEQEVEMCMAITPHIVSHRCEESEEPWRPDRLPEIEEVLDLGHIAKELSFFE